MTSTSIASLRLVEPADPSLIRVPDAAARYNLRAALPDRPGALGALAAALGRTGADIISISIVERDSFDAVDDITFELPETVLIDDVYAALHAVSGIWIESLHPEVCAAGLTRATALLAAVAAAPAGSMPLVLIDGLADVLGASWAAAWPASGPAHRSSRASAHRPNRRAGSPTCESRRPRPVADSGCRLRRALVACGNAGHGERFAGNVGKHSRRHAR